MTKRKQELLAAIQAHWAEYGKPPSHEELGKAMGCSKQNISRMVRELVEQGALTPMPGRLRRNLQVPIW